MPRKASLYTTIVRTTVSYFKSGFTIFGTERKMESKYGSNITIDRTFLRQTFCQLSLQSPSPGSNVLLAHLFLHETMEGSTLQVRIDVLIKHLDQEMDFVMITDRMDEILTIHKEYLS